MSDLRAARIRELGGRSNVPVIGMFAPACDPMVLHVFSRQYPSPDDTCYCGQRTWAGAPAVIELRAEG